MKIAKKIIAVGLILVMGVLFMTGCKKKNVIATMTIKDYGTIKIELYPEEAPKGVENFVDLAESGYYNGVKFHRIIENFMMQGGDPEGTGAGGESKWGKGFGVEKSDTMRHYTGAISYANRGEKYPNSNGSQFFIVSADKIPAGNFNQYTTGKVKYTDEQIKKYADVGGVPSLDGDYTVFGYVIEGMDVVEKIMKVEKVVGGDGAMSSPKTDVVIESITIEK